ncbi:MAG TPA: ABC transporter permease [Gemmatimonadaceae bacterium]|nr:ABC transporter permease [Gemmatimonadaceae bacterium]
MSPRFKRPTHIGNLSMVRLWQLIKKEFKQLIRDPKAKPLLIGSPVVQILLLGYAATTDVQHIRTLVVDHDRTAESRALVQAYVETDYFAIVERSDRLDRIGDALDRGEVVVGIAIPPGFARDLKGGGTAEVQALIDGSDASTATVAQSYVDQITKQYGAKAVSGIHQPGIEVRSRAWYNPSLESRHFNVPAAMGTIVIMICLLLTALGVVREREIGTLDQLLVSPMTSSELMLGKTLPVLCVGLFHLTLFTSIALFHFGVPFRGSIGAFLLASLLFIFAALAMGLLISTVSGTQQEAFMLLILVFLPAVILSGFISPINSMPWFFQMLTYLNPVRHFLDIVRGIFLKGTGVQELWVSYAILTVFTVTVVALAKNRFRHAIA